MRRHNFLLAAIGCATAFGCAKNNRKYVESDTTAELTRALAMQGLEISSRMDAVTNKQDRFAEVSVTARPGYDIGERLRTLRHYRAQLATIEAQQVSLSTAACVSQTDQQIQQHALALAIDQAIQLIQKQEKNDPQNSTLEFSFQLLVKADDGCKNSAAGVGDVPAKIIHSSELGPVFEDVKISSALQTHETDSIRYCDHSDNRWLFIKNSLIEVSGFYSFLNRTLASYKIVLQADLLGDIDLHGSSMSPVIVMGQGADPTRRYAFHFRTTVDEICSRIPNQILSFTEFARLLGSLKIHTERLIF